MRIGPLQGVRGFFSGGPTERSKQLGGGGKAAALPPLRALVTLATAFFAALLLGVAALTVAGASAVDAVDAAVVIISISIFVPGKKKEQ